MSLFGRYTLYSVPYNMGLYCSGSSSSSFLATCSVVGGRALVRRRSLGYSWAGRGAHHGAPPLPSCSCCSKRRRRCLRWGHANHWVRVSWVGVAKKKRVIMSSLHQILAVGVSKKRSIEDQRKPISRDPGYEEYKQGFSGALGLR